jgi:hypothetical protein
MSLLDEARQRYWVLSTLAAEESAIAFSNPLAARHVHFVIVALGDEESIAKLKLATFYEELKRRIDQYGFLDQFVAFETMLNAVRAAIGRSQGRKVPDAKGLAQYLRLIDHDLADDYELLKFERNEIAHGNLPTRILVASVDDQKLILERVLDALPPRGSKGGP